MLLSTPRLQLVKATEDLAPEVAAFQDKNRAHLEPWTPHRPDFFFNEEWWREELRIIQIQSLEKELLQVFLRLNQENSKEIIGMIQCSGISWGEHRSAFLGYAMDKDYQAKGLMREGLAYFLKYLLNDFELHRVEANIMPRNAKSRKLVSHLGFRLEGLSTDYLKIAGRWEDHERWAFHTEDLPKLDSILNPDS
jgi:ribosomal-protein-alanine N-acetyltransferase